MRLAQEQKHFPLSQWRIRCERSKEQAACPQAKNDSIEAKNKVASLPTGHLLQYIGNSTVTLGDVS